jgi:DNA-binding NarL/FixJ family response regulator
MVPAASVVLNQGIHGEQVFQQAADPLPAVADRAFGGAQQFGDAGVGVAVGGQAQELDPQVILVDLDMPGLAGLETIPRLRSLLPPVGIIALTMLDSHAYRRAALAAGADDFIRKAKLSTDLLPAILRLVQARRPQEDR